MRQAAVARRKDLLLTLVMLGIALTPAWLTPPAFAVPWGIGVVLLGVPAVVLSWTHAPWVPTPADELPRIVKALELGPGERFCDLGAGDGRVVVQVQRATGATCVGIEASPLLAAVGKVRAALAGGGATLWFGDLYRADLTGFDAVYVWGTGYSVGTERFVAFLRRSLRPGARVVSYHTALMGMEPVAVDEGGQRPLYTYVIGERPEQG